MASNKEELPTNFRSLVCDFVNDLTLVFPECEVHWCRWGEPEITDEELFILLDHCKKVYPERFFDILYKNEEIFEEDSRINTDFLPKMSFRYLYNCEGVSENTKNILWKYLQLMLFTVVGNLEDKKTFGETMNIFEGIDENVLQEKLQEAMGNITGVFDNMKENMDENTEKQGESSVPDLSGNFPSLDGMPNLENLQSNLKKLFDGKIGKLAKELAEEVADEFKEAIGGDLDNPGNAQDIIKNLMKNPNKIKGLMKTVSSRLDDKMKNGEISKDDIMKEAGQFLNEMKNSKGEAGMNEMLKNMMKGMGGLGKNAKINKGALNRLMKQSEMKDKIMKKANEKKMKAQQAEAKSRKEHFDRIREQNKIKAQYKLSQKDNENEFVFKMQGEDEQEKSFIHPDLLKDIEAEEEAEKKLKEDGGKKKKKKKKKT
tara:strand:+ start:4321 stop:5607 length:1287 start_codon:yes stop_codon:yes gene_type:complete